MSSPPELTDIDLRKEWLPEYLRMFLIFRYEGDESFLFTIDTSDLNGDKSVPIEGFIYPLLDICRYYFKVNYNKETIAANPKLAPYQDKILPLPVVFPVAVSRPWQFLPKITPIGGPIWPRNTIKWRISNLLNNPSQADYRRLRALPKDLDVFFITILRPEEGKPHNAIMNIRRRTLVEGLNKLGRYNIMARYLDTNGSVGGPYAIPKLKLSDYLKYMARSRVGIYVRGSFGCLAFKFGELMALGSAIAGETILNNREILYRYDHFADQFAYDEPEALVERVGYLLGHPSLIDEYARANQETYDKYLAPGPVVAALLDKLEQKESEIPGDRDTEARILAS